MFLRTNIPHAPALQFVLGSVGTPSIELNVDLNTYILYGSKKSRYDPIDFERIKKWIEAWETEPHIKVTLVSDRSICISSDGATMTLQGETKSEHQWLGGWIGCNVNVTHAGGKLLFQVAGKDAVIGEASGVNPRVGRIRRYDLMPKAGLVALAIERGFDGEAAGPGGGDMLVGGGTDARSIPHARLIQWHREYDARNSGVNHQFVEE